MDDATSPRPSGSLTRHTVTGLQWAYLGSATAAVLQLGMAAVMARLLTPAAFGLVALAGLFLRFVDYFAKAGISQALIQKPVLLAEDIRAAFWLSSSLSASFSILAILAAPLAASIATEPELIPVLRSLAIGLVIQGIGAPATALLRRRLRFRALAIAEVGSYVVGYMVVGLAMAVAGAGVFALVGAMLVQMSVRAMSAYLLVRHPVLPTRSLPAYRAIFAFGARISVIGFFEFLQSNLDTLAIGRWAGASQLGLYNRAKLIGELPSYQLTRGLSQVLFPSFSSIQSEHERLRKAYMSAVGGIAAIVLPLNAGMAVAAREIILVLLGPQWTDAIAVLPWLLLASSITLTGFFAGIVAEAQAALNAKLRVAVLSTLTLLVLLSLAQGRSLAAYGAAVAASAAVSHLGYVLILARTLKSSVAVLTHPYLRGAVAAVVTAVVVAATRNVAYYFHAPVGLALASEVAAGALSLTLQLRVGVLSPFRRDLADRLSSAGMLNSNSARLQRAARWFLNLELR